MQGLNDLLEEKERMIESQTDEGMQPLKDLVSEYKAKIEMHTS